MGIFSKNKGKSYSFDYSIQVHSLRPWVATGGPLFISWQRGSSKRGNTAPVNPTTTPGAAIAEYRFEDRLSISATLYSVRCRASSVHLLSWSSHASCTATYAAACSSGISMHCCYRRGPKARMTTALVPSLTNGSSCPWLGVAEARAESKAKLW